MENWYKYCVLKVSPDPIRDEMVNIGLAIVSPNQEVDIRLAKNNKKARSLDSSLTDEILQGSVNGIARFAEAAESHNDTLSAVKLACTGLMQCSEFGDFNLSSEDHYEQKVAQLLAMLVEPKSRKTTVQRQLISTKVSNIFKEKKLLGHSPADINKHLVVPRYPIDESQGLYADFALKNGVYHITQTIDFETKTLSSKQAEAALNSLTLDQALSMLGDDTRRYVIYAASGERERQIEQHLRLLGAHSDNTYNLLSQEQMGDYFDGIEDAINSCPF